MSAGNTTERDTFPHDRYPITHEMPNGASIADWLGTAKTAAKTAAFLLERVRSNVSTMPIETLDRAESSLVQALEELRAVRKQIEGAR
jgi:hypothetical protein